MPLNAVLMHACLQVHVFYNSNSSGQESERISIYLNSNAYIYIVKPQTENDLWFQITSKFNLNWSHQQNCILGHLLNMVACSSIFNLKIYLMVSKLYAPPRVNLCIRSSVRPVVCSGSDYFFFFGQGCFWYIQVEMKWPFFRGIWPIVPIS